MALIEVAELKKIYSDGEIETPVLHGLSFSISAGEFVAIMGPSGSGKSTLLHILGLLDRPTDGKYLLTGRDVSSYSEEELAKVRNKEFGFVFQTFNLLPRTTLLENTKLPLTYSEIPEGEWEKRAREAIEAVGLSHRLFYDPSRLSGGERQRAAIARALVTDPKVIFADEPTGNLDSKSGELVMDTFQRLHRASGRTIILITHETYTAEHAERIIKIRDGLIESDQKLDPSRRHVNGFKK